MKFFSILLGTIGLLFQTNYVYASLFDGSSSTPSVQLNMVDVSGLKSASVTCTGSDYKPTNMAGLDPSTCQSCKQKVDELKQKIPELVDRAKLQDGTTSSVTSAGTSAVGSAATGLQKNSQNDAQVSSGLGSNGSSQRAGIASNLAKDLKQCADDIKSACNGKTGPTTDGPQWQKAMNACDSASSVAQAAATEQQKNAGGLGDAMQAASGLASALGPLAQMLGKQNEQQQPDPYKATPNYQTAAGNSSLAGTTSAGGTGFSSAQQGASVGSTSTSSGAVTPKGFNSGHGLEGAGAFDAGSHSGSNAVDIASAEAAGSTGSSGNFNSSGASKMGTKPEQAAAAGTGSEDFAYGAAGGSGGVKPAMLGLKSKSNDLADLAETGASKDILQSAEAEDGERMLASEDQDGGIHGNEGGSLFNVVHVKYSEIKRRGSI